MSDRRIVGALTGARSEFGLLRRVWRAIMDRGELELVPIVTGAHLLPPSNTIEEIEREFDVRRTFEMQRPGEIGRFADAHALGRGVSGFADVLAEQPMDVLLVLGDRIEPFAAACAAAVAGVRIAHVHGGDRAEGVADESMRHAITKLAHIHLAATGDSAERIIAMGEDPQRVHVVGSPAVDGLDSIRPMGDDRFAELGSPKIVLLLHPTGDDDEEEYANAERLLRICRAHGQVLTLDPNHDPGREGIVRALEQAPADGDRIKRIAHLERNEFIALLKRARVIVGNSSAGLIEAAALAVWAINVGPRQGGRLMPDNVIDVPDWDLGEVDMSIEHALAEGVPSYKHPYGDGSSSQRIAELLATFDPDRYPLRKRNTY